MISQRRERILAAGVVLALAAFSLTPATSTGLDARLENGATGRKHMIETMAGGVALFDYDGDGRLDVFLANGAPIPSLRKSGERYANRLYRNLGQLRFADVTSRAGLTGQGFDIGAATGDFDNDGHVDLFVAGVRANTLYRNRGDGTFEDVTARAGLSQTTPRWAVGAGWFDMENDGDLDLFVVNYVAWDPAKERACGAEVRTYCHPREYAPLANSLYRNDGAGRFTDISAASGIAAHPGKGMGLAFGDANGDHLLDIFVTNDTEPNSLFLNLGGGRFREAAGPAGVALNDDGRALSAMGADFRDFDNDGREDLFLTALTNETFPLFRALGAGRFEDRTYASLVGKATLARSGWSAGIFDFDNDGWKDLFAACSDVQDNLEAFSGRASRQRNLLLKNRAGRSFEPVDLGDAAMHRGAAFADLDGDGQLDAVVTRIGQPPTVFRNGLGGGRHWLTLRLRGTRSNRDAIGALVKVTAGDRVQWNRVSTAVGYASASTPLLHFGLGDAIAADEVEILWPSGATQRLGRTLADRVVDVEER